MKISESTVVDRVIYNRVPDIRKSINDGLVKKLYVKAGDVDIENVEWMYEELQSSCCKQMRVTVSIEVNED